MIDTTGAPSGHVRLEADDPLFYFSSGLSRCSRAALEISESCPQRIREMLLLAAAEGWVRPVAYMPSREHTWMRMESQEA
jgi:hypothetical protein